VECRHMLFQKTLRENNKRFSTRNVEELVCSNLNVPRWNLPQVLWPKKKQESVEEDPKQNKTKALRG
jgi:hypothetical protein